jgi:pimeloyl-ACP methyl ester carboxylesterase
MPYNRLAVEWSDLHFDHQYVSSWFPTVTPTLILSGGGDRIVDQSRWDDPRHRGPHVRRVVVEGGAHFLWIERPDAVGQAFAQFASTLSA